MLINPHTNESFDRKRLVSCLVEWSSEAPIILALVRAGRADYQGIAILAQVVKKTMDEEPGGFDDRAVAAAVVGFLVDPSVRAVVAKYLSVAHGMEYRQAKDELYNLRVELVQAFHLKPDDIAGFIAVGALTDEPAWVESYRNGPHEITDAGADWLKRQPARVQMAMVEFPPMSLVRAKEGTQLHFPAPGELAVVVAAEERNEDIILALAPTPEEHPIAEVRAEWVELVATCGKMTSERVKEILTEQPMARPS
jgi:hypothetical protein